MTYTHDDFDEMESDPRKEAFYYSDRARHFRQRAARTRARLAKGYAPEDGDLSAQSCDLLSDVMNAWADAKMREANPETKP